jgi:hypothetical protein
VIHYSPVSGDPRADAIHWRRKTVFVMQQLGSPVPPAVKRVRKQIESVLSRAGYTAVDATSTTTGRDYLLNIWDLLLGCPVGVAIVQEGIASATMANIYYELGMLQAYGRETVVVKIGAPLLPSDFARTQYIEAGRGFDTRFKSFVDSLDERKEYYLKVGAGVEHDPLLAIDYLRRASLLGGNSDLTRRARTLLDASGIGRRGKHSVEELLLTF